MRFNLTLQTMVLRLIVLLTIIPIHECAHAFVAARLGDGTAKLRGRVTINPLAHLDLMGTLAFMLIGFGWGKPVDVYSRNLRKPKRDMALIALAGPVSNILLATLLMVIIRIITPFLGFNFLVMVLDFITTTSIYLAVFNLLPVPPLDGSRLLEYALPYRLYAKIDYYQRYIYFGMILLLFTGVLDRPIQFISGFLLMFVNFITIPVSLLMNLIA